MLFDMATLKGVCCYFHFPEKKVKAKRGQVTWPLNISSKWYGCYFHTSLSGFKHILLPHLWNRVLVTLEVFNKHSEL